MRGYTNATVEWNDAYRIRLYVERVARYGTVAQQVKRNIEIVLADGRASIDEPLFVY